MQMDPRDDIVLQTAGRDQCDKLAVDRRRYCQLVKGPVYHACTSC